MSRTLILALVIVVIGGGAYFYLNQPEPTPAEQLQSAAEDVADAATEAANTAQQTTSDAVEAATEQASEAASSVTDQAADLADQAGDQVASLANQGQDLFNTWVEDGSLSLQNFDYDKMVAAVQESTLAQDLKTQAIKILDDIKASPETIALKMQELQKLLTQQ